MTFSINAETENEICNNEKMKYAFYNIDHSIYSCESMRKYEKVRESMREYESGNPVILLHLD